VATAFRPHAKHLFGWNKVFLIFFFQEIFPFDIDSLLSGITNLKGKALSCHTSLQVVVATLNKWQEVVNVRFLRMRQQAPRKPDNGNLPAICVSQDARGIFKGEHLFQIRMAMLFSSDP
jgi:hypothetical protein